MAKELWESFAEARKERRHLAGFIFAVVVGVLGFLLPLEGGMTIPWSFIPAIVAFVVLAGFHYWWLLQYTTKLRRRLRPRLQLSFEPKPPWCTQIENSNVPRLTEPEIVKAPSRWFRVKVINPEPATPVRAVTPAIVAVRYFHDGAFQETSFAVPQKLRWAETPDPVAYSPHDLLHLEPKLIDVISLDPIQNRVVVKWPTEWIANQRLFEGVGKYRLTIAVSPAEGEGSQVDLDLNWTGDWATAEVTNVTR
jgi:hypothetical protein